MLTAMNSTYKIISLHVKVTPGRLVNGVWTLELL